MLCKVGKILFQRLNIKLTQGEKDGGRVEGWDKIIYGRVENVSILPLVGYEILYPEAFRRIVDHIDLITHHVGSILVDRDQFFAWRVLQKVCIMH